MKRIISMTLVCAMLITLFVPLVPTAYAAESESTPKIVDDGIPGDINADGKVDLKDAVALYRKLIGSDIEVDEDAIDVNGDNSLTAQDVWHLFQYVSGWQGIEIHRGGVHAHSLIKKEEKASTVDAQGYKMHWECESCGKLYWDDGAVNEITDMATLLFPLVESYTVILYDKKNWADTDNVREIKVPIDKGFNLGQYYPPAVNGYEFVGWSKASQSIIYNDGDTITTNDTPRDFKVDYVPAGGTYSDIYYAHYRFVNYTIECKRAGGYVDRILYTIEDEVIVPDGIWEGLKFAYWKVESGDVKQHTSNGTTITRVEKGTVGDIKLTAYWRSKEDLAVPDYSGDCTVVYDSETNMHSFIYKLGVIDNVVVEILKSSDKADGKVLTLTYEESFGFGKETSSMVGTSISNSVTKTTEYQETQSSLKEISHTDSSSGSVEVGGKIMGTVEIKVAGEWGESDTTTDAYERASSKGESWGEGSETSSSITSSVTYYDNSSVAVTTGFTVPEASPAGTYDLVSLGTVAVYSIVTFNADKQCYYINLHSVLSSKLRDAVIYRPEADLDINIIGNEGLPCPLPVDDLITTIDNLYYVNFDANMGSGKMSTILLAPDVECDLPENKYTRSGYVFAGWNTAADGSGEQYINKEIVKNLAESKGSITLYAQWTPIKYKVTWSNPNNCIITVKRIKSEVLGDNGIGDLRNNGEIYFGDVLSVTYTPSIGYSLIPDGYGAAEITVGESNVDSSQIYASVASEKYTVTYYYNDGTNKYVTNQHTYDSPDNKTTATEPSRGSEYTFLGWSTSKTASTATWKSGETVKNNDCYSNRTLYAVWVKISASAIFHGRTVHLEKNDTHTDTILTGMSQSALANTLYKNLEIKILFDVRRSWGPCHDNGKLEVIANNKCLADRVWDLDEHFDNEWEDDFEKTFTISINDLNPDGSFDLKWTLVGDGGVGEDWYIGDTTVTVIAK